MGLQHMPEWWGVHAGRIGFVRAKEPAARLQLGCLFVLLDRRRRP